MLSNGRGCRDMGVEESTGLKRGMSDRRAGECGRVGEHTHPQGRGKKTSSLWLRVHDLACSQPGRGTVMVDGWSGTGRLSGSREVMS